MGREGRDYWEAQLSGNVVGRSSSSDGIHFVAISPFEKISPRSTITMELAGRLHVFFAFQITLYGDSPCVRVRVFPQSSLPGKCLLNPFRQTLDFQINTFLFPPDEVQKLLFPAFPCALPCQHCTSALIGSFDRQMYHHSE